MRLGGSGFLRPALVAALIALLATGVALWLTLRSPGDADGVTSSGRMVPEPLAAVSITGAVEVGAFVPASEADVEFAPAPALVADVTHGALLVQPLPTLADPEPAQITAPTRDASAPELAPTLAPGDPRLLRAVDELMSTPTPQSYQIRVPDTDVLVHRQTLFMSQLPRPPDFWPAAESVFYERTARYIGWMVDLNYSEADPEFELRGLMRWLSVTGGLEHVIYQEEYAMDADHPGHVLFFMMGNDQPGFWNPGDYRVELWDNRDRVAVRFDFTVKSGLVR